MGYRLQLLRVPRVMRLSDDEEVLTAVYLESGMPYVGLTNLLHLPNLRRDGGDTHDETHVTIVQNIIIGTWAILQSRFPLDCS